MFSAASQIHKSLYYPFHFLGNKEFLCIIGFDLRDIPLSICSLLRILQLSDNNGTRLRFGIPHTHSFGTDTQT